MASTRLCVKGLPKHLTKERLREHFESIGEVTDARICTTSDGRSRCFGFVGFRTEKEANKAKKHFNNSFIDTSKISIEIAKPVGDGHLVRPWSKYSEGSSAYVRVARKTGVKEAVDPKDQKKSPPTLSKEQEILQKIKTDPEMRAFVEAMKPRRKGKVWENDDELLASQEVIVKQQVVKSKKSGGDGLLLTRTHMKFESEESDEEYQDAPASTSQPAKLDGQTPAQVDTSSVAFDTAVDDLQYLKAKMKSDWKDSDDDDDEGASESEAVDDPLAGTDTDPAADSAEVAAGSAAAADTETVNGGADDGGEAARSEEVMNASGGEAEADDDGEDSGRLFVRNLPFTATEEDLVKFFGRYGDLSEVHLCINKETKKPSGIAYILYLFPQHAREARAKLDGKFFQGRLLHILPAKLRVSDTAEAAASGAAGGYKAEKQKAMRKAAGSSHNWSSLFMRSDTVAEAVAEEHDVTKQQLLDPATEGSMAVRMALGETQIIQETKAELEREGVNLAAFEVAEKPKERSRTAVLVKNIPHSTTEQELRELFSRSGDLARVVLPRTRTMAIVDFEAPTDARKAFRSLAYTKFKHVPLYLEWAPVNTFLDTAPAARPPPQDDMESDGDAPAQAPRPAPAAKAGAKSGKGAVGKEGGSEGGSKGATAGDGGGGGPGRTVYVKNLNFSTTEAALRKAFESVGAVRAVKIMTKAKGAARLSMGYGFVEFADAASAGRAVKQMEGVRLDEHVLQVKLSERQRADGGPDDSRPSAGTAPLSGQSGQGGDGQGCTKLMIRNVPFEATKKELRELLAAFAQLSTLRIPNKMDGAHRGFAFADFLTHADAAAARAALQNTHLYGRHLVFEFAEESNSLEALRLKTARYLSHLQAPGDRASKRQRIEAALEGGDGDGAFAEGFDA